MVSLCTLKDIDVFSLTEAWNRCWQGYYSKITFTEENLSVWLHRGQIKPDHSVALVDQGKIIGFTFLSQEGREGYLAGTAIDPRYRGQKLFGPMLQAQIALAQKLNLNRIYLEVLVQNYALKTYQSVGFRAVRNLHIYRISRTIFNPCETGPSAFFQYVSLEDYLWARRQAQFIPAWQRRDHSLKRYTPLKAWLNFTATAGMLYFTGEKGTTLLDAWALDDDAVPELVSELFRRINPKIGGDFVLTNQPQDLICEFLTRVGIFPTAIQHEMVYSFS